MDSTSRDPSEMAGLVSGTTRISVSTTESDTFKSTTSDIYSNKNATTSVIDYKTANNDETDVTLSNQYNSTPSVNMTFEHNDSSTENNNKTTYFSDSVTSNRPTRIVGETVARYTTEMPDRNVPVENSTYVRERTTEDLMTTTLSAHSLQDAKTTETNKTSDAEDNFMVTSASLDPQDFVTKTYQNSTVDLSSDSNAYNATDTTSSHDSSIPERKSTTSPVHTYTGASTTEFKQDRTSYLEDLPSYIHTTLDKATTLTDKPETNTTDSYAKDTNTVFYTRKSEEDTTIDSYITEAYKTKENTTDTYTESQTTKVSEEYKTELQPTYSNTTESHTTESITSGLNKTDFPDSYPELFTQASTESAVDHTTEIIANKTISSTTAVSLETSTYVVNSSSTETSTSRPADISPTTATISKTLISPTPKRLPFYSAEQETAPFTTSASITTTNLTIIPVAASGKVVPVAVGITAGAVAFLALLLLAFYFVKKHNKRKKRAYLDEENINDYQISLKPRPRNAVNGAELWAEGKDENSLIERPFTKNYFQEGLRQENSNFKEDPDDVVGVPDDVINVIHLHNSDVSPLPASNRYSMGPILLQDDYTSTQNTYDKAYTHGTFKRASEA